MRLKGGQERGVKSSDKEISGKKAGRQYADFNSIEIFASRPHAGWWQIALV